MMNWTHLLLLGLALYSVLSVYYVYRWRGSVRYAGFSQYLRKAWPVFAPLNCLLYMTTTARARKPVLSASEIPETELLRQNWPLIRAEAQALLEAGLFDAIRTPGSAGYYDLGFRTFYKRGWSKFYLSWYGTTHQSAQRLCPQTVALLQQVPAVRGAMFSLLPPGAELSLHSDPLACSLRYHLGLITPNSAQCRIVVDGHSRSWQDGQDFVFDETYPHHALNHTAQYRLILMCDVDRPLNWLGRQFNKGYLRLARHSLVPNLPEDQQGAVSALFAALSPWQQRAMQLKASHRTLYKLLKWVLNTSLVLLLAALVMLVAKGLDAFLWQGGLVLLHS
ncbi:aspartyl/asparaginyl beta-hydroxylase domain-containing protein [Rheinheimera sp.]|uniref:aspartyl/asparaginyl beta-hydroxylase domain-containing protein n=1 Tax=Rheinheimera sp. TaxID=1869214 RepID=UPI00307DCCC4